MKCEENKAAHRVLQARSAMVIGRERSRGREDTLGGTPHGYTWVHPSQRAWREQGIGPEGRYVRPTRTERLIRTWTRQHENCRSARSPKQTVWPGATPRDPAPYLVFSRVFCHQSQAAQSEPGDPATPQVRDNRLPTNPGGRSEVESGGGATWGAPSEPLSPLSPPV